MNNVIRHATIEDVDSGLLDVFIEGYRFHQNGRPDVFANLSDLELREDLINAFSNFSILVIYADDNIVGYLSYKIKERHTKKLDVDQLVILEKYRGKGFGGKLMNEVKSIAIDNNCDRIELNCWIFNSNALSMYEHIGFDRQRIIYELSLK